MKNLASVVQASAAYKKPLSWANPSFDLTTFDLVLIPGGAAPAMKSLIESPPLKPKLIKRHAQPHEIQALRDKEGSEAKAKRVCQSKVKDHGLNMEILDAEFQM